MQFNAKEIMNMLPHRAPFLLVDKVIECDPGIHAIGIKNITIDEPFFHGHFPTEPIVPGVLLVETIAQVTAIMYCSAFLENTKASTEKGVNAEERARLIADHVGYLVEIKSMKFIKTVEPGDTMRVEVRKKTKFAIMTLVEAKIFVNGNVVAEGKIVVSEKV